MEIYFASSNAGKVREVKKFFEHLPSLKNKIIIKSLSDLSFDIADQYKPQETGNTFQENAIIKAKALYTLISKPVFAEDSGLAVDVLDGRPGVHSARYAPNDEQRIQKLLNELKSTPSFQRTAGFITALSFVSNAADSQTFFGRVVGHISEQPAGNFGFGYDPIFIPKGSSQSFAEISVEQKESISHRGKALSLFAKYLEKVCSL